MDRPGRNRRQDPGDRHRLVARRRVQDRGIAHLPVRAVLIGHQNGAGAFLYGRDAAPVEVLPGPAELKIVIGKQRDGAFPHAGRNRKPRGFHAAENTGDARRLAQLVRQRRIQRGTVPRDGHIRRRRRKRGHPLIEKDHQHLEGQEHHDADGKRTGH